MKRIRLLLIDDHPVVRSGLRTVAEVDESIEIVGEAATAAEGLKAVNALRPDAVLLDVRLPDRSGLQLCRDLKAADISPRILFLTSFADNDLVLAAMDAWGRRGRHVGEAGSVFTNYQMTVSNRERSDDYISPRLVRRSFSEGGRARIVRPGGPSRGQIWFHFVLFLIAAVECQLVSTLMSSLTTRAFKRATKIFAFFRGQYSEPESA